MYYVLYFVCCTVYSVKVYVSRLNIGLSNDIQGESGLLALTRPMNLYILKHKRYSYISSGYNYFR